LQRRHGGSIQQVVVHRPDSKEGAVMVSTTLGGRQHAGEPRKAPDVPALLEPSGS
jgi:hypothetical protein